MILIPLQSYNIYRVPCRWVPPTLSPSALFGSGSICAFRLCPVSPDFRERNIRDSPPFEKPPGVNGWSKLGSPNHWISISTQNSTKNWYIYIHINIYTYYIYTYYIIYIIYIYVFYSVSAQNGLAFCGQRQSFKGPGFAWPQRKKEQPSIAMNQGQLYTMYAYVRVYIYYDLSIYIILYIYTLYIYILWYVYNVYIYIYSW